MLLSPFVQLRYEIADGTVLLELLSEV
eukprot:COSAG04_NODE_15510_length_530_cov_0.698376_2_plen_26_part_01